jgi:RHS repeat-associated protein
LSGSSTGDEWAQGEQNGNTHLAVTPGEVVTYGGWVERVSGTGRIWWGCAIYNSSNNLVQWCPTGAGLGDGSGGTSWGFYEQQVTIPAGGAYMLFYAELHGGGDTDVSLTTGYFDSAVFEGATLWSQTFSYDPFGNITKNGTQSFQPGYSTSTNWITSVGSCNASYDADGEVKNDCLNTYAWDLYGRPVTVNGVGVTYDALGRAVEIDNNGTYSQFQYSPTGFKMQITNGTTALKSFAPLPGGAMALWNPNGPYFRHADWLGSSRLVSSNSRTVYYDGAYGPFGEAYAQSGTNDLMFTGMDQDTASNVYDFPAREYGIQGRWPSPDPSGLLAANPLDPQSLNRFAYVRNRPLFLIDPTGLGQSAA